MPNTNVIEKYYKELVKSNGNMVVAAKEYSEYLAAIKKLSDTFDSFLSGDKKNQKLEKKDVEDIRKYYDDIFDKGRKFLDAAKTSKAGKDKTLKTRIALVRNAEEKITESSMAFAGAVAADGMTLPEILDTIRGREIEVDEKQLNKVGDVMSCRIPLSFNTETGKKVEGYFTEYTNRDFKKERDELINRVAGGNKTLKNIFTTLFTDKELMKSMEGFELHKERFILNQMMEGNETNVRMAHILGRAYPGFISELHHVIPDKAQDPINDIANNMPDLDERVITFLREGQSIYNKYHIAIDGVKMVGTKKIEDRNAAMTAVADLLGCSNIIARSTKMTIVVNGQPREGVFMENAEGSDLSKIDENSPLSKLEETNNVKPEFYSQLADLQILDFICGNTDRHIRNMMYKTETEEVNGKQVTKVSGLMGIDNDSSFGLTDGQSKAMRMPSIDNIKVINSKTAERVKMMTPELLSLALKPYHLDKKEVLAAQKRLKLVKKLIVDKKIVIADDEKWKTKNFVKTCVAAVQTRKGYESANYFGDHINLKRNFDYEIKCKKQDKIDLAKLNEDAKSFSNYKVPEKTESVVARGREMQESDMVEINNERFLQLQHQINTATAFNGTKEYQNIADLLNSVGKLANKTNKDSDLLDWQLLKQNYNRLEKMVDTYLDRKEKEQIALFKKGKVPSSTAESRVMAMTSLKRFLQSRDVAVTKYCESQCKEAVNVDRIKEEVAQIRRNAENGPLTEKLLAKLTVKEFIINNAANGKIVDQAKEYNDMLKLAKTETFRTALARINNPKERYGIDDAINSLNHEMEKINPSSEKKVEAGEVIQNSI